MTQLSFLCLNNNQFKRQLIPWVNSKETQVSSYDKSGVYRIGSLKNSNAKYYTSKQLNWANEKLSILGITISNNMLQDNYPNIVNMIKDILYSWHFRGLSLLGKVIMLNALVGPLFVYKINVSPLLPDEIINAVNKMLKKYL